MKKEEKKYMNPHTGSVDTKDGWGEHFNNSLIEVKPDGDGWWIDVDD